jgi:hypothetical protein
MKQWKEVAVTYFKALPLHSNGRTENIAKFLVRIVTGQEPVTPQVD